MVSSACDTSHTLRSPQSKNSSIKSFVFWANHPLNSAEKKQVETAGFLFFFCYKELCTVENRELPAENGITALLNLSFIEAAREDDFVSILGDHIHSSRKESPISVPKKRVDCHLSQLCENGSSKLWAREAVDTELMHAWLKEHGIGSEIRANVAVVDSGFDGRQKSLFDPLILKTAKVTEGTERHPITGDSILDSDKIGNPDSDEDGHGTMVASVIAGKEMGVARNISLSVYRATKENANGGTSGSLLDIGLYRACVENQDKEGVTLINLSWGGRFDEAGIGRDEADPVSQKLFKKLADMGCLVTKAGGNSSFKRKLKDDLDDAYLRVSAIDGAREMSDFSSEGEISAPGSSIYVIESKSVKQPVSSDLRCNAHEDGGYYPKALINGTSFAAPMAAAVGSQIVRVLKTAPFFAALAPPHRIKLVNRILKSSTFNGSINGLRAVAIAHAWNKAGESRSFALGENGLDFLEKELQNTSAPLCKSTTNSCLKERICSVIATCLDTEWKSLLFCKFDDKRMEEMRSLYASNGAPEKAYALSQLLRRTAHDEKNRRTAIQKTFVQYMTQRNYNVYSPLQNASLENELSTRFQRRAKIEGWDPSALKAILAPYFSEYGSRIPAKSLLLGDVLYTVLQSQKIQKAIEKGVDPRTQEDRGSNSTLGALHTVLFNARQAMGRERFWNSMAEYVEEFNQKIDNDFTSIEEMKKTLGTEPFFPTPTSTTPVRILDSLAKDFPPNSPDQKALFEIEETLLQNIRKHNQFYGATTQTFVFLTEEYPGRSTLIPLLERHSESTRKAIDTQEYEKLAAVEVQHFLESPETISPGHFVSKAMRILSHIGLGKGWGMKNDREILDLIFVQIRNRYPSLSAAEKESLRSLWMESIRGSTNPFFLVDLVRGWNDNRVPGTEKFMTLFAYAQERKMKENGLGFRQHPLFDTQSTHLLGQKLSLFVSEMKPEDWEKYKNDFDFTRAAGTAWKLLLNGEKSFSATSLHSPILSDFWPSRLSAVSKTSPLIAVEDDDQLFTKYLISVLNASKRDLSATAANEVIKELFDTHYYNVEQTFDFSSAVKNLPKDEKWLHEIKKWRNSGHRSIEIQSQVGVGGFLSYYERSKKQP